MTIGISVALANAWLNTLKGEPAPLPAALYVGLHVGEPGVDGTQNVSAGASERQPFDLGSVTAGGIQMVDASPAWSNFGGEESLTHVSVWSDAGVFQWSALITSGPLFWGLDSVFTLDSLQIIIGPLADTP